MDSIDKNILHELQEGLPLTTEPYKDLACSVGVSTNELLSRVKKLRKDGFIRRIGGVLDSRSLGFSSTLCAISVSENDLDRVKNIVNSYPEVTHNYIRNHNFNMWFTIISESKDGIDEIIAEISRKSGLQVNSFPAEKVYKINAKFNVLNGSAEND